MNAFREELDKEIAALRENIEKALEEAKRFPAHFFNGCDEQIGWAAEYKVLKRIASVYDDRIGKGATPEEAVAQVSRYVEGQIIDGAASGANRSTSQTTNVFADMEQARWANLLRWNMAISYAWRESLKS